MSLKQNDIWYESREEARQEDFKAVSILFDADVRNKFKNDPILKLFTVSDMNEKAWQYDEISHLDYYRNKVALNKLPF